MSLLSSKTDYDAAAETVALHELSSISSRVAWSLSGFMTQPRASKTAIKNIRRDLQHLETMAYISGAAIRKSQINMALQDLIESAIHDQALHKSAQAIHQNFTNIVLADDLIHWSPDSRSVIVLLPTPGYPLYAWDQTSYTFSAEYNNATSFALRFDLSSCGENLSLNSFPFVSFDDNTTPLRISATQALYTHANISDLLTTKALQGAHVLNLKTNASSSFQSQVDYDSNSTSSVALDIVGARFAPDRHHPGFPRILLDGPTQHIINITLNNKRSQDSATAGDVTIKQVQLIERVAQEAAWTAPQLDEDVLVGFERHGASDD